jgi:phenylalanyl-tRNA synthetase beta chain
VTLDEKKRDLLTSDLLIADGNRGVGLAGVMGGANSEVSASTTSVLLESASFDATTIRRTALRLGLRSEASARFEKSLPPYLTSVALGRTLKLVHEGFGGGAEARGPATLAGDRGPESTAVSVGLDFIATRLAARGDEVEREARIWCEALESLGIRARRSGDSLTCEVPWYRATKDLTEPIDLVEEIARIRGYERVRPEPLTAAVVPPPSQGERRALVRRVEDRLCALGFRGLETYSFLSDAVIAQLGLDGERFVQLQNSLVAGESRVRREVLPSVLALVAKNAAVEADLRLFEVGKGYRLEAPRQDPYVGAGDAEPSELHLAAGVVARSASSGVKPAYDSGAFFAVKGVVAALLEGLDVEPGFAPGGAPRPYFHPQRRLEVHPTAAKRLGVESLDVAAFELDLTALEAAVAAAGPRRFTGIPRFPGISVDVSLAAPASTSIDALEALVLAAAPDLCRGLRLFDIYAGPELGEGRRSAAFHLELRSDERTLTDADENGFLAELAKRAKAAGVELRGWKG